MLNNRVLIWYRIYDLLFFLLQIIRTFEVKPDANVKNVKSIARIVLSPSKKINLRFIERKSVWGRRDGRGHFITLLCLSHLSREAESYHITHATWADSPPSALYGQGLAQQRCQAPPMWHRTESLNTPSTEEGSRTRCYFICVLHHNPAAPGPWLVGRGNMATFIYCTGKSRYIQRCELGGAANRAISKEMGVA